MKSRRALQVMPSLTTRLSRAARSETRRNGSRCGPCGIRERKPDEKGRKWGEEWNWAGR